MSRQAAPTRSGGTALTAAFLGPISAPARALVSTADAAIVADPADADVVHASVRTEELADRLEELLPTARVVVLHQRPDSLDPSVARHLAARSAAAEVVVAVPFVHRFYPMVRLARRRVRSGVPGPLHLLHGWASPESLPTWTDAVEFITRHRITRLCATSVDAPSPEVAVEPEGGTAHGAPSALGLIFETDRGGVGTLAVSSSRPVEGGTLLFALDGIEESIRFHEGRPEVLDAMGRRATQRFQRGVGADVSRYSTQPAGLPQGHQDCWSSFVLDAHAAARGRVPDGLPTLRDVARSTSLAASVRESLATGTWAGVGPDTDLELVNTTEGKSA